MHAITLRNFRCFHEEQHARLAPLTLLVGENSVGKTSFMALIRALWNVSYGLSIPDFKEAPYDLGSFDEIAHHRGGRGSRADTFEAGYYEMYKQTPGKSIGREPYHFEVTFEKQETAPVPVRRRRTLGDTWLDEHYKIGQPYLVQFGTSRGTWEGELLWEWVLPGFNMPSERMWPPFMVARLAAGDDEGESMNFTPLNGSPAFGSEELEQLNRVSHFDLDYFELKTFASAPVRSKPQRTYDPSRPTPDPEGDHVPMYLANLFSQDKQKWVLLKERLENYGRNAGLFGEISIKRLGKRDSEPFQVQVRNPGSRRKGPPRNLIDVGYGVSQALPVITELLREDAPSMFLLQQPEVHLHPSAQAALGSLFCQIAGPERQLVVETHSDHLMDRVRMDVRDGVATLKPADVSILFFERNDLDVQIHSLQIDEEGNILGAPDGYRNFFMEEVTRSMWKHYGAAKD